MKAECDKETFVSFINIIQKRKEENEVGRIIFM